MKKVDETVLKETKYILIWSLCLSVVMQIIFIIIGIWNYTFILGNLLSEVCIVLNFFLMGITVQNSLEKDEKDAKRSIKLSQIYRLLFMFVAVVVGVVLPCFSTWTIIIPIFFPRIAIAFRPLFDKKNS